ncbi:MAG: aldehyde ferredoxin oxidoreductase family protein [Bacteroidales bacterium]|nr:aldehyde ferredoxin oxidoreductase family protein [Bacteroidales bacterium]
MNIDLSTQEISYEVFPENVLRKYIGGSGLGAKILYERTDSKTDPLGPENILIFMTGPFTGTMVPTSGRHEIVTRSPLTNIYAESDAGGYFGINLKKAGFDGVIIRGFSKKPVYIMIEDGHVEIIEANKIWNKETHDTDRYLTEKHGKKCHVSCIGPAGEKQIAISGIAHDGEDSRMAARAGVGAVMGSKNLKAIVVKGTGKVPVMNIDDLRKNLKKRIPEIREKTLGLNQLGTAIGVVSSERTGDMPLKNWQQGNWDKVKNISGEFMATTILKKSYHCGSCPIGCGRDIEIVDGKYGTLKGAGPEYETIALFGGALLIDDLEGIAYINSLCNKFGLDSISTGATIAFAMELYEKDILSRDDLDGLDLKWGNVEATIEMVKKIGNYEGIGKLFGKGVRKAAEIIGGDALNYAIHVKGLEFPGHDPRAYNSMAVGYATSNRGACHVQGGSYFFEKSVIMPELGYDKPLDRLGTEGKGKLNYDAQNIMSLMDSLKLCKFILYGGANLTDILFWIKCVVGWDMSLDELMQAGERIFNLKRMYNNRCGISRKDDTLPRRILEEPRNDTGTGDNLPQLEIMLEEYYQCRGWDSEGVPKKELLERLELNW